MRYMAHKDFKWVVDGKDRFFTAGSEVDLPTSIISTLMCHGYIYGDPEPEARKNFQEKIDNKMITNQFLDNKTKEKKYKKHPKYIAR